LAGDVVFRIMGSAALGSGRPGLMLASVATGAIALLLI